MDDTTREKLDQKLNPNHVKKHPYTGCSYIEGWHAIAEANRIFSHEWDRETIYNKEVCRYEYEIKDKGKGWKVGFEAKVKIIVNGITREGTGHGSGFGMDLFDCIEGAAKEAETDAMKRALMTFGNPFGLALYDKDQKNVGFDKTPELIFLEGAKKKLKSFKTYEQFDEWKNSEDVKEEKKNLSNEQIDWLNKQMNITNERLYQSPNGAVQ